MNFFIWRKSNISFSRYLDFCVFVKSTDFKICDVTINILHNGSYAYAYAYFFWILSAIKMEFGQILVCCMTNISNMFLTQYWRLETSSRLFYDFIKIIIQRDLAIFNSWHLPSLIVPYSPFQTLETLESWHNWLLSNSNRLLN